MTSGIISRISKKLQLAMAGAVVAGSLLAALPLATSAHAATNCDADSSLDSEEQAFLGLINNYRQQNGLAALSSSDVLSQAASWKSQDMASNGYFAHDDASTGRNFGQRLQDCGYSDNAWTGENIAAGMQDAAVTFNAWKNSPGHNANMLGSNYTVIGIGRVYVAGSPYGWYWTTDFGSVSDAELQTPPSAPPTTQCADVDGNGFVNIVDIVYVVNHYRTDDSRADLDHDGLVTVQDVVMAISQVRTHCEA